MKTLIIHPEDPTTEFLTTIYANLNNKTVIKGGVSKLELREMIEYDGLKKLDRILITLKFLSYEKVKKNIYS